MKLVTRDTDYAMRSLCFIARRKDKIVSVGQLVKNLKIPKPFLRKILQRLNKEGLLKSHKGRDGGFILAKAAGRIFLTDLIGIFQGPVKLNECLFKNRICPNKNTCLLKKKIDGIERSVISELQSITIASLMSGV